MVNHLEFSEMQLYYLYESRMRRRRDDYRCDVTLNRLDKNLAERNCRA